MFHLLPQGPIPLDQITRMKEQVQRALFNNVPQPLPEKLWHYTDAGGCKGIIENGRLRATHLAHLNDASEYLHAVSILVEAIRSEKAQKVSSLRQTVLEELEAFVTHTKPEDTASVFVACFSIAENSLNQWRAYGNGEGGYCLGFETKRLFEIDRENGMLVPVIYDKAIQTSLIASLLQWALNEYEELCAIDTTLGSDRSRRILWWNWFVIIGAASVAPVLKNPAFQEEAEWRYIHLATENSDIEFLPRPLGLRPYIDLDFRVQLAPTDPTLRLPLTDLWSGPGRRSGVSLMAGRVLLEKHKYGGINLHSSEIPFRVG
ncbi:hypothetical protein ABIB99_004953 [Bradyrhizobium sp. LA6.1]|uniref:DUF2971 domain-containing protein n=1 Tax=Bradyrhizobium sp. LA6.1 TaxID=3156378 RepID=UPI003394FE52